MAEPHAGPSDTAKDQRNSDALYTADHVGPIEELPQPRPLDHDDPLLSPRQASHFNVDAFLVSRAPGATLVQISNELQTFGSTLKSELDQVVDRDFRGFVNLGVALKAEGPRIARLDWKVSNDGMGQEGDVHGRASALASRSRVASAEQEWADKLDIPLDASGNLGLERVRTEMESVRDGMRAVEASVRSTLAAREAIEIERTNLHVLLSFSDSLKRLESLLIVTDSTIDPQETDQRDDQTLDHTSRYWRAFEQPELDPESDEESDYYSSSDDDESDTKQRQMTAKRFTATLPLATVKGRRRSSGIAAARRRSSLGLIDGSPSVLTSSFKPTMTLPSRIARASSEHAALIFLADRARSLGYSHYIDAHQMRLHRIQTSLKDDLTKLVKALTSIEGSSLLIGRPQAIPTDDTYVLQQAAELNSWSQVSSSEEEKRTEQNAWLELAISTWSALPQEASAERAADISEVEDTIAKALVEPWCRANILPTSLNTPDKGPQTPKTPKTPAVFNGSHRDASASGRFESAAPQSMSLSQNTELDQTFLLMDTASNEPQGWPLMDLYNKILGFVAASASRISAAAENVMQTQKGNTALATSQLDSQTAQCEVFVRALWRPIATRLMEQLGGQLFFVGRPEAFRRNYTTSTAFVALFARLAPSTRAGETFRHDPVLQNFRKRWQLPVYFQMRLRDIVTQLENSLLSSSGTQFGNAHGDSLPLMTATKAAVQAFVAPWTADSHIRELSHRQWRLSLQIVSRYRIWLQDELPAELLPAHRRVIDASRSGGQSRSSFEQQRFMSPSASQSTVGSPTRTGTPTSHDADVDNHLVTLCTAVAADIIWFEDQIRNSFETVIAPLLAKIGELTASPDMLLGLRETLHASLSLQSQVLPLLSAKVTAVLKTRCAEPLRLVRSVSTQYRSATSSANMSNGAMEPSFFVVQFLRPVRYYLGRTDSSRKVTPPPTSEGNGMPGNAALSHLLARDVRQQWIGEVIDDFVVRYTASLQTMSKNFESLQRLKRVNAGKGEHSATSTSATAEDGEADKMHAQMTADVEHLQKEVEELQSVQTTISTDTQAWMRLRAAARGALDN